MKNTIIIAVIAFAIIYFVKEGEKVASTETENMSNPEKLKLGLGSTIKKLLDAVKSDQSTEETEWQPESVHDKMPLYMMNNANDASFSKFTGFTRLPKKGNFIRNEYRQSSN